MTEIRISKISETLQSEEDELKIFEDSSPDEVKHVVSDSLSSEPERRKKLLRSSREIQSFDYHLRDARNSPTSKNSIN